MVVAGVVTFVVSAIERVVAFAVVADAAVAVTALLVEFVVIFAVLICVTGCDAIVLFQVAARNVAIIVVDVVDAASSVVADTLVWLLMSLHLL